MLVFAEVPPGQTLLWMGETGCLTPAMDYHSVDNHNDIDDDGDGDDDDDDDGDWEDDLLLMATSKRGLCTPVDNRDEPFSGRLFYKCSFSLLAPTGALYVRLLHYRSGTTHFFSFYSAQCHSVMTVTLNRNI